MFSTTFSSFPRKIYFFACSRGIFALCKSYLSFNLENLQEPFSESDEKELTNIPLIGSFHAYSLNCLYYSDMLSKRRRFKLLLYYALSLPHSFASILFHSLDSLLFIINFIYFNYFIIIIIIIINLSPSPYTIQKRGLHNYRAHDMLALQLHYHRYQSNIRLWEIFLWFVILSKD